MHEGKKEKGHTAKNMTMVREGQNPNHCRVVEADRRASFAPTVASWCPPLDLWYTMGVRQSAKQQRTEEKMFRPLPNGEDDAPQPVLTDDQRESVFSDEDGMKLLSADPHLVSDCILMKRYKPATVVITSALPLGSGLVLLLHFVSPLLLLFSLYCISESISLDIRSQGWILPGDDDLDLINKRCRSNTRHGLLKLALMDLSLIKEYPVFFKMHNQLWAIAFYNLSSILTTKKTWDKSAPCATSFSKLPNLCFRFIAVQQSTNPKFGTGIRIGVHYTIIVAIRCPPHQSKLRCSNIGDAIRNF
ncbi:hypothetical protein QQ045_014355 [Rhodiola kirilowii]